MIDVGAVLADAARFMPDKAAPAIKRGIVALRCVHYSRNSRRMPPQ